MGNVSSNMYMDKNTPVKGLYDDDASNRSFQYRSVSHNKNKGIYNIEITGSVLREVVNKFIPMLKIHDHRQVGKIKFSCQSIIFILVLACMCHNRSSCAIGRFGKDNQVILKKAIPQMPDIPISHDTIKRTIENMVFDEFQLFLEIFALQILFECLSDMHVSSTLPKELIPFYKEVLLEYNIMQKERNLSVEEGGSPIKPPYHVYLYSSANSDKRLQEYKQDQILSTTSNIIDSIKKHKFLGCCSKAKFLLKQYSISSVSSTIVNHSDKSQKNSSYTLEVNPKTSGNKCFKANPSLKAMASGYVK